MNYITTKAVTLTWVQWGLRSKFLRNEHYSVTQNNSGRTLFITNSKIH